MQYRFDGFNYLIRLDRGESLRASLEEFVRETKLEGAWLSGIGAVLEVTIAFYDLDKKEYHWQHFLGLREVVSLSGNLAFDEQSQLACHLHGVFSDRDFRTVGGHIKDLTAAATIELFAHRTYQPIHRKMDPEVGLQTLDL
jgi:predicted DNA-binding protein with PD1-like motif